jgi:glycosyltransferase involved in cell wall biosynthesis
LIVSYNEAPNIERCLAKLRWAQKVILLDSFSADETLRLASAFPNVRTVQRRFDCFKNQIEFGLQSGGMETEWALVLDADYVLSDEIIEEMKVLRPGPSVAGYRAKFRYRINGQPLRSTIYPPVIVLVQRKRVEYVQDGHAYRARCEGEVQPLHSPIDHDDRKPFKRWFKNQRRYADEEANKILGLPFSDLDTADRLRVFLLAPWVIPFYCLIVKGLIRDGWHGLLYTMQRTIFECLLVFALIRPKNHENLRRPHAV